MKLVEDINGYKTTHIIINGNGTSPDLLILKKICEMYDGTNKIILYPRTPLKRHSGLSALQKIYTHLNEGYRNIIFIVDSEHIQSDANAEIKKELIGIIVNEETRLKDAFLLDCQYGNRQFNLYCNISGFTNCIEEELKTLIEAKLCINIEVSSVRKDAEWRNELKNAIKRQVSRKDLRQLLNNTNKREFESHFSNLCAIFREIENKYI